MKTILLGLFLICAFCSYSQQKNDSKIVVSVIDTTELFNRVVKAFYSKEYTLDNKDKEAGFISTKEKHIDAVFPTDLKLRVQLNNDKLVFSGEFKANVVLMGQPPSWEQIKFWGMKKGVAKTCWAEMESIAKQFGTITYSK